MTFEDKVRNVLVERLQYISGLLGLPQASPLSDGYGKLLDEGIIILEELKRQAVPVSDPLLDLLNSIEGSRSEYEDRIKRWTGRFDLDRLTEDQAKGYACVSCGADNGRFVVVGYGKPGISSHVFACVGCDWS